MTGWPGPAQIPGGARKGWGGARIPAVLNYHKQMLAARFIRDAIQPPWQSHPLKADPGEGHPAFPIPVVRSTKVNLPLSKEKEVPKTHHGQQMR